MANEDIKNNIPDETMVLRSSALSGVLSTWKSSSSEIVDSINVGSMFAILINNDIASDFFKTLENNITTIKEAYQGIINKLDDMIQEQQNLDQEGAKKANDISDYAYTNSNYSRRGGTSGSTETTKEEVDTAFTKKEFDECIASFDELDHVSLVAGLYDIVKDNPSLLNDESFAEKLQQAILENINIPEELKKVIMNMDAKEVQVLIKNIAVNEDNATGFSKEVLNTLDDKDEETIVKLSTDYPKELKGANVDNIQNKLDKMYSGDVSSNVSDDAIFVTRVVVDSVAENYNVTSEEVLNNPKYRKVLAKCTADLIKTFSYIDYSNKVSPEAVKELYSNLFPEVKA